MKKNSLLLLLFAFTITVSSCNKDDDPAPPPVVGNWDLDRYEMSDLPAAFSDFTGIGYDNNYFLYYTGSKLDIRADKTFQETYKNGGYVFDFDGTWEFTNNTLNLNYTDTDVDDVSLTYDPTKMRLYGEKSSIQDSLPNISANRMELVRFNIQQVYIKR